MCEADKNKHNQEHRFLMDMLLLSLISKNNLFCYLVDVSKFELFNDRISMHWEFTVGS